MPHTTRRRLFGIGFGALAAGVPVESRPNDAALRRLADEWLALEGEIARIVRVSGRRWGCDPEDGPLASRCAVREARQTAIARAMIATPADTSAGMDAKFRIFGYIHAPPFADSRTRLYDRLAVAAADEAARLCLPQTVQRSTISTQNLHKSHR